MTTHPSHNGQRVGLGRPPSWPGCKVWQCDKACCTSPPADLEATGTELGGPGCVARALDSLCVMWGVPVGTRPTLCWYQRSMTRLGESLGREDGWAHSELWPSLCCGQPESSWVFLSHQLVPAVPLQPPVHPESKTAHTAPQTPPQFPKHQYMQSRSVQPGVLSECLPVAEMWWNPTGVLFACELCTGICLFI